MDSKEIRSRFKSYFEKNGHKIVPSSSMIVKGDPTLMFTNAGMNQFKDIFLGIRKPESLRVADSQKCLRVSGKHNDLEDVGHDTYHHTMFEMLGNWSFGDYFKEEAIRLAWNLLTEEFGIEKDRLYVTVFGGDKSEGLNVDTEAEEIWKKYVSKERIIYGSKKDNFWEMGDMGPCGPCSEIHIDLRENDDRKNISGDKLVNQDNPLVIEIWNLVFIQYNRKADGSLEPLPQKHVDTGMGFERLCTVLQGKKSNYDTDIFQTIITQISKISGKRYGDDKKTDIALRVVADHLRAVSFAIADGQLPSNNKAGYVIRRILRRSVRYAYSFLGIKEPFMYKLIDTLTDLMGESFPELISQKNLVEKVILDEETVFLRTLERGLRLLDTEMEKLKSENKKEILGNQAFILYDTFGFPFDLTELIARENGFTVDKNGFDVEMAKQKERARNAADISTDDWIILNNNTTCEFVGYDKLEETVKIIRYRKVTQKNETLYHIVFDKTPFYAEKGGQVGDCGLIVDENRNIEIINTIEEHNLKIHITKELPNDINVTFLVKVNKARRIEITNNHTATHLLHEALRSILGTHVEQKGSMVNEERLRFDFAHFNKMTTEEIRNVEIFVNERIRENIEKTENRSANIEEAKAMGAMALFGEKYGNIVRVVKFGNSIELCGGTHVESTGQIGFFKIISESAIAAGIRRIEAITGRTAQEYIFKQIDTLGEVSAHVNNKDIVAGIENLIKENSTLKKQVEVYKLEELKNLKKTLAGKAENINGTSFICSVIENCDPNGLKEICTQLRGEIDNFACVLGCISNEKPNLVIALSENLIKEKGLHSGNLVKESAKLMMGGGGGQAFIATAGGKDISKLSDAIEFAKKEILSKLK